MEDLKMMMVTNTTSFIPFVSLSLLEVKPHDNFSKTTISFASFFIRTCVYQKHQQHCISLLINESGQFTEFRTTLYEEVVHTRVPQGVDLHLKYWWKNGTEKLTIPPLKICTYYTNDNESVNRDCYYKPKSKSFGSLDAFIFSSDDILTCFQVTAAQSHDIGLSGIRTVIRRIKYSNECNIKNIKFIFIMPRKDLCYNEEQRYTNGGKIAAAPRQTIYNNMPLH